MMLGRRVEVLKQKLQDMERDHQERLTAGVQKWEVEKLTCVYTYIHVCRCAKVGSRETHMCLYTCIYM